ncbi:MAG: Fic family protein, partial [Planctomycetales bacterium]|nr:Fic family protein [Planctomycetales bacterium]
LGFEALAARRDSCFRNPKCEQMAFDPAKPFNDLPSLPPDVDIETKPVLKACIAANKALAELKGAGDLIPNQAMLINAIPLQEAQDSSAIENIVTTKDKLFRAAGSSDSSVDPATKEVLRYRKALHQSADQVKESGLTVELLCQICSILRDRDLSVRDQESVFIGDRETNQVVYTPPRGRDIITAKLGNLVGFLNDKNDGTDPLVKLAVSHYQFEAIHPFDDGNGRTGRILNLLYLLDQDLLNIPVLYLSRYIIQNKSDYYRLLREVTEQQEWENWLLYMLDGIEQTANWTTDRIRAIRSLFETTLEEARDKLPKRVYSKELIELIFVQPYVRIANLVDSGLGQRKAASEYLKSLEDAGFLVGEKVGREVVYRHPRLIDVLSK